MLYEDEYRSTRNKKEFKIKLLKKYKHLKETSAERRFYDCKKELGEQIKYSYPPEEKQQPPTLKMIEIQDMKKYNLRINRKSLRQYGFKENEINWLEDEDYIEPEEYL